jgi:hypothetical protein
MVRAWWPPKPAVGRPTLGALVLAAAVAQSGCSEGYPTDDVTPDPRTHIPSQADILHALNDTGRSPSAHGQWSYRFQAPCSVAVARDSQGFSERRLLVDLTGPLRDVQSDEDKHSVIISSPDAGHGRDSVLFVGRSRVSAIDLHTWMRRLRATCPTPADGGAEG